MKDEIDIKIKFKIDEKTYDECVAKINELKALENGIIGDRYLSNFEYIFNNCIEFFDVGAGFSNLSDKMKNECDCADENETGGISIPIQKIGENDDDLVKVKYKSDTEKTECIPATLKDVCEWWIKNYSTKTGREFIDTHVRIIMVRDHMKHILSELK